MKRAKKFDQASSDALARAVRDSEKERDAEIVIVVRGRSGIYRHADYLCGAIVALTGLIFVLFSPFEFHTYWVPIDVVLLFVAGAFLSSRSDTIRRLLTAKKFRAQAARNGAAAMFDEAGIANTHSDDGGLIYLSPLDRRLEVITHRRHIKPMPPPHSNTPV